MEFNSIVVLTHRTPHQDLTEAELAAAVMNAAEVVGLDVAAMSLTSFAEQAEQMAA